MIMGLMPSIRTLRKQKTDRVITFSDALRENH